MSSRAATISTPLGKRSVVFEISVDADGTIHGRVIDTVESVTFLDPRYEGDRLCWSQRVTKPLRITLEFEMTVGSDEMHGVAKVGKLPRSRCSRRECRAAYRSNDDSKSYYRSLALVTAGFELVKAEAGDVAPADRSSAHVLHANEGFDAPAPLGGLSVKVDGRTIVQSSPLCFTSCSCRVLSS